MPELKMLQPENNNLKKSSISEHLIEKNARNSLINAAIEKLFLLCGLLAVIILILIVWFLISRSMPALLEVGVIEFLTGTRWMPSSPIEPGYGALPFILSSIFVTCGALVIAVPWGLFSAIYIGEIATFSVKEILKPLIEILAIFPSVVLGFFALVVLGPIVASIFGLTSGLIGLTGAIILGIMTLPTIISLSEDALNSVPNEYREAAYALGASKWQMVRHVTLPAASSGIVAAIMLGFGRSVGETMAILMAAGNALRMPIKELLGLPIPTLMQSVRTLTANIAIEGSDVAWGSIHYHSLFFLGLILFVISFAVNMFADIMLNRFQEVNQND